MGERKDELSEDTIRQRLAVKEVNLRRTLKKLNAFGLADEFDNATFQLLLSDIANLELFGTKARTIFQAYETESADYEKQCTEREVDANRVQQEVQQQRAQLEKEKLRRKHLEDCDALRRSINALPSRQTSEKEIAQILKEIDNLTAEGVALTQKTELRQKQFGALLHTIHSLQSEMEAEDIEEMEKKLGVKPKAAPVASAAAPAISKGPTPSQSSSSAASAPSPSPATSAPLPSPVSSSGPLVSVVTSQEKEDGEKEPDTKDMEETKPTIIPRENSAEGAAEQQTTTTGTSADGADTVPMQAEPTLAAPTTGSEEKGQSGGGGDTAMKTESGVPIGKANSESEEEEGALPNA